MSEELAQKYFALLLEEYKESEELPMVWQEDKGVQSKITRQYDGKLFTVKEVDVWSRKVHKSNFPHIVPEYAPLELIHKAITIVSADGDEWSFDC